MEIWSIIILGSPLIISMLYRSAYPYKVDAPSRFSNEKGQSFLFRRRYCYHRQNRQLEHDLQFLRSSGQEREDAVHIHTASDDLLVRSKRVAESCPTEDTVLHQEATSSFSFSISNKMDPSKAWSERYLTTTRICLRSKFELTLSLTLSQRLKFAKSRCNQL